MKNIIFLLSLATVFLTLNSYSQEYDTKATFVGIGIVIEKLDDGFIKIDRLIPNAPAEKSGLEIGDLIVAVKSHPNDKRLEVQDLTLEEVVSLIRGPEGVPVEITFIRSNPEENVISIVREKFDVDDET